MTEILEQAVVDAAKAAAKAAGWRHRKVIYAGRRGAPDDWFFRGPNAQLRIIEFKRPGKDATEQQAREIDRFRQEGFDVRVINTVEDARAAFRD